MIGFKDNPKPCNEYVVIIVGFDALPKSAALVWDAKNNSLMRAPVDFTDAEFQAWYTGKIAVGESLFGFETACGQWWGPIGTRLSGCQVLIPGEYDTSSETEAESKAMLPCAFPGTPYYSLSSVAPKSSYFSILLPLTPVAVTGFRTAAYIWPSPWEQELIFYGPFGEMASNKFSIVNEQEEGGGYISTIEEYIPTWQEFTMSPEPWPGWNDIRGKVWFGTILAGQYSNRTICNVCMLNYALMSEYQHYLDQNDVFPDILQFTPLTRSIYVQAQALSYEDGTDGKNFIASGRNTALETQVIAAIELAYLLNAVPANEIRSCVLSVSIVQ